MSLSVNKVLQFRHPTLEYISKNDFNVGSSMDTTLSGGLFQDTRHAWHAKGPSLEVRNIKTGCKVGAWIFGCILKDSNTRIVCVEEIRRPHGRLSLLAVGIHCTISGGLVCIFDVFSSKVIRTIHIKEKISNLHVIDPGIEDLNLPGPLRNFDGILAVGTDGGRVILIDICRQICEEALFSTVRKDELDPCKLVLLTPKNMPKIEHHKETSVREGNHLAIHLNVVLNSKSEHFILKGPKGDDRIYVNKEEVITSGLYYCPQLTSLLVGYNFGAFQLWDLTTLTLVYTSPVCDEHMPVTKFALQEPADDPRAFCYIWVSFSKSELDQTGLPFAVMYSLCYESKEYHEGYGFLYQDFQHCSLRFQVELGPLEETKHGPSPKWGCCLGIQPITKLPTGKEQNSRLTSGDTLALCLISWTVWLNEKDSQTSILIFDLNQWYKEQMPNFSRWSNCNNYLLRLSLSDPIHLTGNKAEPLLDVIMDSKSLRQFVGVQRLEEHFYPTSLSFDLLLLRENSVVSFHNIGLQQALLYQIESTGPLCLIRPSDVSRQVLALGLTPLFSDESLNSSFSTGTQREIIMNVGLEHQLVGWLCKCASEWANGSFASAGCSLDFLVNWAFQRAIAMKTHCDKYCAPLFDHSRSQLDNNTTILLNSCIRQINNLCTLYSYIMNKLSSFLSCPDLVDEQKRSLQMVSVYFEVLQWLVNVGLLPEYAPSLYPQNSDKIGAPYPVQELTNFYNEKRTELQLLNEETFASKDSLLFIDNLIHHNCGGTQLHRQWREDNGSGLYPPPSLQSLIRTYLIDVAEIKHKHSLVIYLFLDLAMALEKSRYSPVITYLIKFPAVFKVSTSIIKITQAFWQLDHGDFTTAMEQLLDPFVLGEDLQPWQHTIAMRSLCVQKQYNFALLYVQTRRPPMTNDKDVLTAISLFVSNKMLDEAFYFMKHNQNGNDEKLLMHLFDECRKNDCLHSLLYKNLGSREEQAFIKYLKQVNSSSSDELQVFYYLLRSRYLEAFDFHDGVVKRSDRQGLIGQSNVSMTDQIIRIFKALLPDVNKNLVEYIRKERTNLWKEVSKPTPLSVFVHNSKEKIQYKSTLIHAALAKAKHTFQDNFNETSCNELLTEETPFLRTPKAFRNSTRIAANVITPNVIELNENGEGIGPSPPKKLKLTPRLSTGSPPKTNVSVHSIMLTPIVKRKTSFQQDLSALSHSYTNICTPQSILKGRNIEDFEDALRSERKSSISLQSRRSLSRTPRPQHVQFQDSFSDQSSKPAESMSLEDQILQKSLSPKDISHMVSSKESSHSTTGETFYSPNTSLDDLSHEKERKSETYVECSHMETDTAEIGKENAERQESEKDPSPNESPAESVKGRRSYKRPFREMSPVRSSPRFARNAEVLISQPTLKLQSKSVSDETRNFDISLSKFESKSTRNADISLSNSEPVSTRKAGISLSNSEFVSTSNAGISPSNSEPVSARNNEISLSNSESISTESLSPIPSPRFLSKVRGRRSLSRRVLEQNTFSKLCTPTTLRDTTVSKETSFSKTEKTVSVEKSPRASRVTTVETSLKISDVSRTADTLPTQKSHTVSGSVSKKEVLETSLDSNSSFESDVSFDLRPQTEVPDLDISDSVNEYMKTVYSQLAGMQKKKSLDLDTSDIFIKTSSIEDSRIIDKRTTENDQLDTEHSGFVEIDIGQGPKNDGVSEKEDNPNSYQNKASGEYSTCSRATTGEHSKNLAQSESCGRQGDEYSQIKDKSEEVISMEIYEDLSSGADDKDSYTEDPSLFNELEINVFETTGSTNLTPSRKIDHSFVSFSSPNSDSYFVPDTEKAFIEYTPNEENVSTEDAIVISSSEDEDEQIAGNENKGSSSDESRSSVNLQVSFEQNIQGGNDFKSSNQSSGESNDSEEAPSLSLSVKQDEHCLTSQKELSENIKLDESVHKVDVNSEDKTNSSSKLRQEVDEAEDATEVITDLSESATAQQGFEKVCSGEINKDSHEASVFVGDTSTVDEEIEVSTTNNIKSLEPIEANEESTEEIKDPILQEPVEAENKIESDQTTQEDIDSNDTAQEKIVEKLPDDCQNEPRVPTLHPDLSSSEKLEKENKLSKKKDQSTNTTFAALSATTVIDNSDDKEKLTHTQVDENIVTNQSSQTSNKSVVEQTFLGEVDWASNRKVYGTKGKAKTNGEDSSSDTTEGDTAGQDIVVTAQVHTPTKKQTEEPPVKRITRRSISLMSQNLATDTVIAEVDTEFLKEATIDVVAEGQAAADISLPVVDDVFTLEKPKSTLPSSSRTTGRATKPRRLSQRSGSTIDCEPSTSKETIEAPKVATLLKRTRSASVDEVKTYSRKRTLKRSNSVDEENPAEPKPKGKARSVSQMPVISEELKMRKDGKDSYTASRRITRRQVGIVRDIPTPTEVTAEDDSGSEKPFEVDDFDPIELLDKEPFQGEPDPEEKKVYEVSPPPSISTSSSFHRPTRRKGRSASVASDVSLPPSASQPLTPEKQQSRSQAGSPTTPGVRTRSRKQSETSSIASEQATTPKRSRRKPKDDPSEVSTGPKRTRSRAESVSSVNSDPTNSPRKILRTRRLVSAKSDLPEITEEKVTESKPSQKKNTRKKK